MSQAETTITTSQPVARASRRSLIGGAALSFTAAASAVGITAGLAASIADLAEQPYNPDAALIALCHEYVDHSTRHSALCAKQDGLPEQMSAAEDAEWSRLDDLALEHGVRMGELEDEIPKLPALTPAGQRARAEALLELMRYISPKHGSTFARSLARDLVGRASV